VACVPKLHVLISIMISYVLISKAVCFCSLCAQVACTDQYHVSYVLILMAVCFCSLCARVARTDQNHDIIRADIDGVVASPGPFQDELCHLCP